MALKVCNPLSQNDKFGLFYSAACFEPVSIMFILYQSIKVHVFICQRTLRYYCV